MEKKNYNLISKQHIIIMLCAHIEKYEHDKKIHALYNESEKYFVSLKNEISYVS